MGFGLDVIEGWLFLWDGGCFSEKFLKNLVRFIENSKMFLVEFFLEADLKAGPDFFLGEGLQCGDFWVLTFLGILFLRELIKDDRTEGVEVFDESRRLKLRVERKVLISFHWL